ncbi:flagellar assembly factor FliW [Anaerocolumna cellulosilytica]|uniref:Flagellar assembly factor FliW n=1 Tax=Anaerocolumna cellulosilytica TaxID=433286 RepID=A0A6S6QTE3_9FIRM|nr:flagellar assembly protein FliW [Anaerocolumna cellulosilytica]MBB5195728.1 flagellar assembly factor FliW [Anaerocolumna cellulosilytica]BCJ92936.1 flagellar assembly factor FliW [Anaerocolumna cellulosilytica]
MLVKTKYFGEIDLEEAKIITFERGIMGFEQYKQFTILYDIDSEDKVGISWLQSLEEPSLALPVINPFHIRADYNPIVEDEVLKPLGNIKEDNLVILLSLTVPSDLTKMTANLKAPFIINSDSRKGSQIIVENADYEIKYNIYDVVQALKKEKGEK